MEDKRKKIAIMFRVSSRTQDYSRQIEDLTISLLIVDKGILRL